MQKPMKTSRGRSQGKSTRSFRGGVLLAVLLTIGVVTAIAKYESRGSDLKAQAAQTRQGAVANPGNKYGTVEVAGKKPQVDARTLQQGPLTQEQTQQIAEALSFSSPT